MKPRIWIRINSLCAFLSALCLSLGDGSSLDSKLHNYDIVYSEGFSRRLVKRGSPLLPTSGYNRIHEVNLKPFGKNLKLFLTPVKGLLAPNFEAVIRNSESETENLIPVDPDDFLEGHVYGETSSRVSAHFDEEGALTGSVHTPDESYFFEPAWRHVTGSHPNATLAYRASDLKEKNVQDLKKKSCGEPVSLDDGGPVLPVSDERDRKKRQSRKPRNRCSLKLVADYRFFREIGDSKPALTIRYLVNLIQRVNDIYTTTIWEDELGSSIENQGFVIKKIVVEERPHNGRRPHWNMETSGIWAVKDLLSNFTKEEGTEMTEFCLVHLFTYQSFHGGVLGLGYIASDRVGTPGGICSALATSEGRVGRTYYNSALSSARSTYGDAVITREADIVTAHEFGHNWGSPHDRDPECNPSHAEGGSYIMNTYSVQGYDSNNKIFSKCSKRSIKAVLEKKSSLCFVEDVDEFCGNQRVERDETCDVGLSGDAKNDPCCSKNCQLKPEKQCSPKNSVCCTADCKFAKARTVCQPASRHSCKEAAYCNGAGQCEEPKSAPNKSTCRDQGECRNGECIPFCERFGMKPCICTKVEESCLRCCANKNSVCEPYRPAGGRKYSEPAFKDGRPCIHGYCSSEGVCVKSAQDVVEHIWSIIQSIDSNSVGEFLKRNLVGTIIILSLIVWIPASCVVHRIDKKREMDARKQWTYAEGNFSGKNRIEVAVGVKKVGTPGNMEPGSAFHL